MKKKAFLVSTVPDSIEVSFVLLSHPGWWEYLEGIEYMRCVGHRWDPKKVGYENPKHNLLSLHLPKHHNVFSLTTQSLSPIPVVLVPSVSALR